MSSIMVNYFDNIDVHIIISKIFHVEKEKKKKSRKREKSKIE
jgi:hypothetical protein